MHSPSTPLSPLPPAPSPSCHHFPPPLPSWHPSSPAPLQPALPSSPPRAFRLHLSSKAGKSTHLRATPRFGGATRDPREFFFDSLISNTPFGPCPAALAQQLLPAHCSGQQQRQFGGRQLEAYGKQPQCIGQQQEECGKQQQCIGDLQEECGKQQQLGQLHGVQDGKEQQGWQQQVNTQEFDRAPGGFDPAAAAVAAAAAAAPKVIWLPAGRLQQSSLSPMMRAPSRQLAGLSPLSALRLPHHNYQHHHHSHHHHHHYHHHHGSSHHSQPPACNSQHPGGLSTRPVSLLRCEGVDWEQLLQQLPPEWRAIAALHHAVVAPMQQAQRRLGAGPGVVGRAGTGSWEGADAKLAPSPFGDVDAFIESVCTQVRALGAGLDPTP